MLSLAATCMIFIASAFFLEPAVDFFKQLETSLELKIPYFSTLLKILGIGLTTELSASVCSDAGNSAVGKTLQFLGSAAILYLSIPVYGAMMDILRQILGDL